VLVYGDRQELVEPRQRLREIDRQVDAVERVPAGIERHAQLVAALTEAGQLLQGIADAAFADDCRDRRTAATDTLSAFLVELSRAVCRSWDTDFRETGSLPRLESLDGLPAEVELRVPEGFAFYALYPEAYAEAARRLKLSGPPRVIGIRSIGTSLAAVVAAALGTPTFVTVRPFGNPYAREIAVDPALERELLDEEAHYVIVDEGPGQSGSSFGAVAGWLEERGVPLERVALLPSHAGAPGSAATGKRRRWWGQVQRQVGDFGDWPALVEQWCTPLLGPLDSSPQDISGGAWRRLRYAIGDQWPATVPAWERRKFLVTADGEQFLVKFAGLGRIGDEKLAIARALYLEGFVPKPVGLVHGFLVEEWLDDAAPLERSEKPLGEIALYIGARARLLPAASGSGASVEELLMMTRRNISLELGDDFARELECWRAGELEPRIVRVRTDNRLDRHEWLRRRSGALIKMDALDHHQAHDLIGCQDLAWDVAGAMVEFDVDQSEAECFIAATEDSAGRKIDRELLECYRTAYLAWRLGWSRLGGSMTEDPAEQLRLKRRGDRYAAELQHCLESNARATPPESSVG
jgi:hypothetical protein